MTVAAQVRPIINGQSMTLSGVVGLLAGYSVRETAGARAVLRFRDGTDTTRDDNILITLSLAPQESTRDWFMPTGISYHTALYVEIVSGTIEGTAQVVEGASS